VECSRKLCVLCTDNDNEFTVAEFASYCADEGVQRHYSTLYNPQQNDVVERRNQTIMGMTRVLLKQRGMLVVFWGGSGDNCLHPQPLAHQGTQLDDTVRGLACA
jgi:transposase InsO family protein